MFKRLSTLGFAATAASLLAAGTVNANPIIMTITPGTGGASYTMYTGGSSGCSLGASSCVNPGASSFGGWNVTMGSTQGTSYSPSASPIGLDLGLFTAACTNGDACETSPLTISISDTGFTTPGEFGGSTLGNTQTGSGTVEQWAFINSSNTNCTVTGWSAGSPQWSSSSCTGTQMELGSPLTLNGSGTVMSYGTGTTATPYSLTLVDQFTANCSGTGSGSGCVTFSEDNNVTAAPEPGSLAIFGAGLLGCALFVSRRRRASRQS